MGARNVETGAITSTTRSSMPAELVAPRIEDERLFPDAEQGAVEIVDYRPPVFEALAETWKSRHLFRQVFSSALMQYLRKYRLGPFWIIFETFMAVVGYSLIGGGVFNLKAPNGMPYFLFLMVGIMGYQLFQTTLTMSTRSFLRLRSLVRDMNIPLIVVPIAGSAQALIRFFVYMVAYVIAILYYWAAKGRLYAQLSPKYLAMSVLGLGLCLALAWGIGMWTAPLTAHTRDVRMVLKFVLPFMMFVTPVMYPIEHLHGKTKLIAELNPLSSPVEMAKVGLLGAGTVRVYAAIWSIALIAVVFLSGSWFISRYGHSIVGLRSDFDDEDDDFL